MTDFMPLDAPGALHRPGEDVVLVYRYLGADDGLPGGEATFAICTFWLVQCLALRGRRRDAEDLFCHVVSLANDVGLFSEEIDPVDGELPGNFPQAFTHIALINTAVPLRGTRGQRDALRPTAAAPSGRADVRSTMTTSEEAAQIHVCWAESTTEARRTAHR